MFGLFDKSSKGKIEKEFGWLTLEHICSDLDEGELDSEKVVASLCRLAIYGGINYKNTIYDKSIYKNFDSDKVIVEGVGFIWSNIYYQSFKTEKNDVYENKELADGIFHGSGGICHLLNEYVDFEIKQNFSSKYSSTSLIEKTDKLIGYTLSALNVDTMSDIKSTVKTQVSANNFATTMLPAISEAADNLLIMYLGSND